MNRTTLATSLTAALVGGLLLAACGSDTSTTPSGAAAKDPAACAKGNTVTAGTLTIATGDPAFPPYVINDATPQDGQGLEAGVAMAVAKQMGFEADKVKWVRTAFDAAITPGPKDFDFNLQQFTISQDRAKAVDFSDGYYTAPQAVLGLADSPAASAKTIADLKGLKIGVAVATTSLTYVEEQIKPTTAAKVYNDNNAAKVALESKQIDAIVADLPTALYISNVEIEGSKIFGQIEGSAKDQFGMLLAKGSKLTSCVNGALAKVKASGELDTITKTFMSDVTPPTITK